jgi:hypothetical protein
LLLISLGPYEFDQLLSFSFRTREAKLNRVLLNR